MNLCPQSPQFKTPVHFSLLSLFSKNSKKLMI
jgi:hypothetical protein